MPNHAPPQLFLIDGYALIYRAFFAMISRPLRTTKGENTSAAWGVVNFLLRLREKYRPDYVAWINDAGTSFREERYPDYKSTREKLDDSLQADFDRAVERIGAMLEAFRIPLVTVRGYEADDVIGTLATTGAARGLRAVIVSGDKDFYQLIGPGITLLNPGRGGPAAVDEVWVDESNGAERLGVPPHQVVDFLALVGDSSDNIPGVKGIGEKGAQKLLADFGDLETILARAGEITREAHARGTPRPGGQRSSLEGAGHHQARRAGEARRRGPRPARAGSRGVDQDPDRARVLLAGEAARRAGGGGRGVRGASLRSRAGRRTAGARGW